MKKLLIMLIAFATLQVSAQEQKRAYRNHHTTKKINYTPEQMAQLKAKRMTLMLDLNEIQQKDLSVLFLEDAKLRQSRKDGFSKLADKENGKILSKDERFKMENARLDYQIERQRKLKNILTDDQYSQWTKMTAKNRVGHKNPSRTAYSSKRFNYKKQK